jgi:hypothetical protein
MDFFEPMVMMVVILALYLVPTCIAAYREHPSQTPILLVNLLLGWTALGWVIALVWSVMPIDTSRDYR